MPNNNKQCPENHYPYLIKAGDTLYQIAQNYNISIASILEANPGIDPKDLMVGQQICLPRTSGTPGPSNCQETITAMQRDIDMLKAESHSQQVEEVNYSNSAKKTTSVVKITATQIQFDAAPVVFSGNYRGQYTAGKSYPYYADAAMGGQRGITVKDNFGIWHSFGYRVPINQ